MKQYRNQILVSDKTKDIIKESGRNFNEWCKQSLLSGLIEDIKEEVDNDVVYTSEYIPIHLLNYI